MAERFPLISLMTDFGAEDVYVGVMKGVIARICPEARVVDLTHAIPSFDVAQAAFRLRQAYPWFPKGAIHVVVVDPGVGSGRGIVAMRSDGHVFIAPDNGALSVVQEDAGHDELREVAESRYFLEPVSASFHGRDIFAPVAAHVAAGTPLSELGPARERLKTLDAPKPQASPDGPITGAVLWSDRFGNLVTNIPASLVESCANPQFRVGSAVIQGLSRTYADVAPGEALATIGAFGMIEFAVRLGSAAEKLRAGRGAAVVVNPGRAP